ncbi:MAG: glycosyltransferase family 4 protein [Waterburya sp.]
MKLVIILPSTQRGGAEEYTLKIAQAALEAGWQIDTAFPQTPDTASLIADFKQQNIGYYPLNIADQGQGKLDSIKASLLRLFRTQRLLSQLQPDVVLLNLPAHHLGFMSLWVCGLLQIPTAVVFHLIPFSASFTKSKLRAYHWAKARNQQWITISQYNCQRLGEEFSLASQEFRCIYNGIKDSSISFNGDTKQQLRLQIRQELGLEANSQILLTVARLHPQKGHDYLIPIMPAIIARFPNVQFVWVGDGEYQADLNHQLQEYQVKDKVSFLGYRQDIPNLLAAADLFLFPSYQEGLPFAVLEAMIYGLPIVASDTGGIPEMIVNEEHGLLFRTGDRQDLLEKLDWALNHPAAMAQMANMAQIQVQKFSEATMLQDTLEVLQNLTQL